MNQKPIIWMASARDDLRSFPEAARRRAGFELRTLQRGLTPSDSKTMRTIGPGVQEVRIRVGDVFRIFYVSKFEEALYVLHAFQKKTQKTARKDISIGKERYKMMHRYREQL